MDEKARAALLDAVTQGVKLSIFQRRGDDPTSLLVIAGTKPIGMIYGWSLGYDGVAREQVVSLAWRDGFVVTLPFSQYVDPIEGVPDDVTNADFKCAVELTGDMTWETP